MKQGTEVLGPENSSNDLENARLGYSTLAEQVALVSQEIYSRFNVMLTANSIIIAVIGLILTSDRQIPKLLPALLSAVGILLCIIWLILNCHGIYWQTVFRKEARRLEEKHFVGNFWIWSLVLGQSENSPRIDSHSRPWWIRLFPYRLCSSIIIAFFGVIHIALLFLSIYDAF